MDPYSAGAFGASLAGGLWSNVQNLGEGKRAREWSANMAGSAWQRAVIDMKAAGLNPALAYGQGPAATPGASQGNVEDAISPAVASAQHQSRLGQELKLMKQQTARQFLENDQVIPAQTRLLKAQEMESKWRAALARRQSLETTARTNATNVDTELSRMMLPGARNTARVESSRLGAAGSWMDRIYRLLPPVSIGGATFSRGAGGTFQRRTFGVN